MTDFHNWTGDEEIDTQVPQFLNEDNAATQEKLDTKLSKTETAAAATRDGAGNNIVDTYAKKTDISGMVKSVNGTAPDASGNVNVKEYTHPASGVTAGSYRKVTVDTLGHVTAGENPILAVAEGGTGADNATSALSNLGILGAIVNASVSGTTITFTKKDNTKITIDTQDTNNGIVAALLQQNGYIKFANGLILQWGVYTTGNRNVTITLPIATSVTYAVLAVARTTNSIGCTGSQNCQYVSNVTSKTFKAGSYDAGNGYAGFWWLSIGKD